MKFYFSAIFVAFFAIGQVHSAILKNTSDQFELLVGAIGPKDTLVLRRDAYKPPIEDLVVAQTIGMTGLKEKVSYVWAKEEGESQGATAAVVCGGLGENEVGVRFTSLVNRGFHFNYEIYGTPQDFDENHLNISPLVVNCSSISRSNSNSNLYNIS